MNKFINFVFWPAVAGLVLSLALLATPQLVRVLPVLERYFPAAQQTPVTAETGSSLLSFNSAIRKAMPAVVSINNLQLVNRKVTLPTPFPNIVGVGNMREQNNTLGSGVIISPDGYIVTSYHVMFNPALDIIRPEQDITVTLNNRENVEASLVSLDAKNDLALLKIDAGNITHLQMAPNSAIQVGDIALAIGNPRNIGQSVSQGIISALWKRNDSFVIQTDAAINPGNSGGALIDINGQLIGVNSTIVSESGGSEGISFAVPASKALALLSQFLTAQQLDTGNSGYLGVDAGGVILEYENRMIQGVQIKEVTRGSAADMAGIQPGDIITAVNDRKLPTVNPSDTERLEEEAYRMIATISDRPPGELVMLEVFRDKELIRVPTILGIGEPRVYLEAAREAPRENVGAESLQEPEPVDDLSTTVPDANGADDNTPTPDSTTL